VQSSNFKNSEDQKQFIPFDFLMSLPAFYKTAGNIEKARLISG